MTKANLLNEEYWLERSERSILVGEKSATDMLKDFQKIYDDALKEIQKEIEAFYGRYAKETKLSLSDVKQRLSASELFSVKTDISRYYDEVERLGGYSAEFHSYLRSLSAKAYMSRLEELKLQIRLHTERIYREQYIEFTSNLRELYSDTYYHSLFDMQQGFGFANNFEGLNTKLIEKAISQKWLGDNYSDRIWANKERLINSLNTTFLKGVALGYNPRKIGKEMSKIMGVSYNNAVRLARTEFNFIANQATKDGYKEHGIVQQYKYLATLDFRTSDICQELDGKIFDIMEQEVGINYPPMHPNCRSTTIAYFEPDKIDAMFKKAERAARDDRGKTYYVPADINYKQWKEGLKVQEDGSLRYVA